jgi:hypothetical protein
MVNRNVANVVDASLRDLTSTNRPFGGKIVVYVGDFQQLPPVIPRGRGEHSSIHKCEWFRQAVQCKFTRNWRAAANPEFADVLECIGNGSMSTVVFPQHCICASPSDMIVRMYGDDIMANHTGRMILTLRVDDSRMINEMVINMLPGSIEFAESSDAIPIQDMVQPEYVAGLTISGVPEFRLPMKIGARYMILKNYSEGVCNGVLCVLRSFSRFVAQVELLTGPRAGSIVPLPRVVFNISASSSGLPFDFVRTQFPITLAYCTTVHKSQGQTLRMVGLYFTTEPFAHGQLYVALSRVSGWDCIFTNRECCDNIVFKFLVA